MTKVEAIDRLERMIAAIQKLPDNIDCVLGVSIDSDMAEQGAGYVHIASYEDCEQRPYALRKYAEDTGIPYFERAEEYDDYGYARDENGMYLMMALWREDRCLPKS